VRDVSLAGKHHNVSRAISSGTWLSQCSGWLTGRREGFPALVWAVVVNLILFGLLLSCATPNYESNDDLVMQLIASGFYTGQPDAHLVFTNILIGWVLRFFYETWAGCNWYLVYLLLVHYAALTAIAFLVVSRRGGWRFALLYTGFFLLVETHLLLHLQFTTSAFLIGTAGLLLVVDGLTPGHLIHWTRAIVGLAFWALMCLIREPVALFLVAVACPFLLERFDLVGWRRLVGAGLACLGILLVLHGANRWAYLRDRAWAEYSHYNHLRGEIHDTPLTEYLPQADPAVGWSRNDGWMFSEFYFSEPDVYGGVPRMQLLLERLKTLAQEEPASWWWRFPASFVFLPNVFHRDAAMLMTLAILNGLWCVFAAGTWRRRVLATLLISYVLYVALTFYLLTVAHLPDRITYNLPLFLHAICLYWATGFRSLPVATAPSGPLVVLLTRFRQAVVSTWAAFLTIPVLATLFRRITHYRQALMLTLVLIWAALYLFNLSELAQGLWSANASNRHLERTSRKIFKPFHTLLPRREQPLLIMMPADSVLERCLFFRTSREKVPFSMVPSGWITHSPLFRKILDQHHLHPYSLSLVDRPDVFFLMQLRWREPLKIFYREHFGLKIRFDLVLNTDPMPQFEDCQLHLYQAHTVGEKALSATESR
jgi:hypothetical protein